MKVYRLPRCSITDVDTGLRAEQIWRGTARERATLEDFVSIYEPNEAFSTSMLGKDRDMVSVRAKTKEEFEEYIERKNVPLITMHRGGGMMWHGPGQINLSPLVDLRRLGISITEYSELLEEVCVRTVQVFGVRGVRHHFHKGSQGAWVSVGGVLKKIAFFGWKDNRGIAIHGCTINVSPNLLPFSYINPCNLRGVEATSLQEVLGFAPPLYEVACVLEKVFVSLIQQKAHVD
ncbi:MAG: hypothetical protein AAB421_00165 [Patescibacteria group bacterium]